MSKNNVIQLYPRLPTKKELAQWDKEEIEELRTNLQTLLTLIEGASSTDKTIATHFYNNYRKFRSDASEHQEVIVMLDDLAASIEYMGAIYEGLCIDFGIDILPFNLHLLRG